MAIDQHDWLLLTPIMKDGEKKHIGGSVLVNLATVRRAEITSIDEIRLMYSESHIETVKGAGASEIIALLLRRSMLPNGEPSAFLTATMSDVPRTALPRD
jgi:hypothetical protein